MICDAGRECILPLRVIYKIRLGVLIIDLNPNKLALIALLTAPDTL